MEWADLGQAARELAAQVVDDGYDPEMILSIARGGLLVGAALGYALAVKNVYTMNVEYYTGVDERLEVPRILPPAPDFVDLQDARILIADDVADTGHTLESVQAFCAGKVGEVRVAVLYEKPPLGRPRRLRLASDRPLDRVPVVGRRPRRRPRRRDARRLTGRADSAGARLHCPSPGEVAQLVEHTAENRGVAGSSPALAILMRSRPRAQRRSASATRARLGTASDPSAPT